MILKILDCLNLLTTLTSNQGFIKTLFLGDLDLRNQIHDLQLSANHKVFAKASFFIATHYREDVVGFDDELDLFIT